ncbi:MAG: hypothetical protein KKF44_07630, partial [Nanoarchaeota archaeon]|nr:hypothetical protein [Nanoarchaeota archaeon]
QTNQYIMDIRFHTYSYVHAKSRVTHIKIDDAYTKKMNEEIRFHPISWKSKVGQKRSTYHFTINKLVARGCNIQKGDTLYSYVGEDRNKRPVMVTYLDSGERVFSNRPVEQMDEDPGDDD